jgi:NAD-specific glutamate dehydrogenase
MSLRHLSRAFARVATAASQARERLVHSSNVQRIGHMLSQTFLARFEPSSPTTEASYAAALDEITTEIESTCTNEQSIDLLRTMTSAARHTLRTNAHIDGRWALSLRLDPAFFQPVLPAVSAGFSNLPYGTFFVAGRKYATANGARERTHALTLLICATADRACWELSMSMH